MQQTQGSVVNNLIKIEDLSTYLSNIFKNYFPFLIFYSISIFVMINFIFSSFFIAKKIARKPVFINVFYIRTPNYYIWIFLFSCLFAFLSIYVKINLFKYIARNAALICGVIYILEGGLIFIFKILTWKINPILKILIIFIPFLTLKLLGIVIIIFLTLGILDYWFDFRKVNQIKNNNIDTLVWKYW